MSGGLRLRRISIKLLKATTYKLFIRYELVKGWVNGSGSLSSSFMPSFFSRSPLDNVQTEWQCVLLSALLAECADDVPPDKNEWPKAVVRNKAKPTKVNLIMFVRLI